MRLIILALVGILLVSFVSATTETVAQNLVYNDLCTPYAEYSYTHQSFKATKSGNLSFIYVYAGSLEGYTDTHQFTIYNNSGGNPSALPTASCSYETATMTSSTGDFVLLDFSDNGCTIPLVANQTYFIGWDSDPNLCMRSNFIPSNDAYVNGSVYPNGAYATNSDIYFTVVAGVPQEFIIDPRIQCPNSSQIVIINDDFSTDTYEINEPQKIWYSLFGGNNSLWIIASIGCVIIITAWTWKKLKNDIFSIIAGCIIATLGVLISLMPIMTCVLIWIIGAICLFMGKALGNSNEVQRT